MNYATRKALLLTVVAFAAAGLAWAVLFWWQNFRGIGPAVGRPVGDVADLIAEDRSPIVPPNAAFGVEVFARGIGPARDLALDESGAILVSVPAEGKVLALLPDGDGDGVADRIVTVVDGLDRPHGLAQRCLDGRCVLYVAEEGRVSRFAYDLETHTADAPETLAELPQGGRHTTRSLLLLTPPEGDRLLVSIGSSCDVCHETDERRAAVYEVDLAEGGLAPFAAGLRNSVFLAQHPVTGDVWATEMGRDFLGDDLPPDEVNILERGRDYGWPTCYGKNVHDTVFDKNTYIRDPCEEPTETASHVDLPAHVAPLGLAFIPEEGWPEEWWHHLLVAEHGSWNSSVPVGYKVVRIPLDAEGRQIGPAEDFITGFLTPQDELFGRPVDMLIFPGGTLYVSDDKAGVVYRFTWRGEAQGNTDADGCVVTGCSDHVCADEAVMTTCEWREEYACYKDARCERQADGRCGWTETAELLSCLSTSR